MGSIGTKEALELIRKGFTIEDQEKIRISGNISLR